jgi:hypothetical protein
VRHRAKTHFTGNPRMVRVGVNFDIVRSNYKVR